MKTEFSTSLALAFLGLSLLAAACGGTTPTPPYVQTWIDAPLPGDNLAEAPYWVMFHGASFSGISEFELSVNGAVESVAPPESTGSGGPEFGTLFFGKYLWSPPAPGTYLLGVRSKHSGGSYGPVVEVQVTVGEQLAAMLSPPALGPVSTSTTSLSACTYVALQNLFCRLGPGRDYREMDSFEAGQSAEVMGFSADGFYAYVVGLHNENLCAVPVGEPWGQTEGECSNIPQFTPPPLPPTLTPTPLPHTPTPTVLIHITPIFLPSPTLVPPPH